ncbi:hypothetical protein JG688_00017593, partial [Phytophthora aleatoria]
VKLLQNGLLIEKLGPDRCHGAIGQRCCQRRKLRWQARAATGSYRGRGGGRRLRVWISGNGGGVKPRRFHQHLDSWGQHRDDAVETRKQYYTWLGWQRLERRM